MALSFYTFRNINPQKYPGRFVLPEPPGLLKLVGRAGTRGDLTGFMQISDVNLEWLKTNKRGIHAWIFDEFGLPAAYIYGGRSSASQDGWTALALHPTMKSPKLKDGEEVNLRYLPFWMLHFLHNRYRGHSEYERYTLWNRIKYVSKWG